MITSNQNPKIKLARALLGRSKEREQARAFVIEGVRLVEEAVNAGWPMRYLLHSEDLGDRGRAILAKQKSRGIEIEEVSPPVLQSVSDTETTQGILAVMEQGELAIPESVSFVLILDRVRDPGNLGTLLRTAAAAAVQIVLLPPETTDAFAPKVLRAGMGAHFRIPIRTQTWDRIAELAHAANLALFLANMGHTACWDLDLSEPLALIIGSEAEGPSDQARELATRQVSVPMPGSAESLNAAVAGAVLMFEVVRQRRLKHKGL